MGGKGEGRGIESETEEGKKRREREKRARLQDTRSVLRSRHRVRVVYDGEKETQ